MTKLARRTLFYSILLAILLSVLFVPGRFAAQASLPLAPTAPGHNIYFQAVGLPDGVTINISGSRVNNGGNSAPYSTSFTTPNLSPAVNADPGSVFTYTGYPASLEVNGLYYELISLAPTSPITVGVSGGFTNIVGAYMAVCQSATITVEPVSQTVQVGDPVTFTLSATGTAPLTFEWYKEGELLPDADQDNLVIPAAGVNDAGMYHAVVQNACGTDTSDLAQLTVNRWDQEITFDQPDSPAVYGSTFWVTPTASSGLTVSLSASGGCSNSSNQVSMVSGTAECVLVATQAGNEIYNPAADVERTVAAAKAEQAIDFSAPASPAGYGTSFELEASASSGLAVGFEVQGVCELAGNIVSMTSGTGNCVITASQAGDDNYNPATDVERTVAAAKAEQAIDFSAPASPAGYGTSFELEASASSGLAVGFEVQGVCELAGNIVSMTSGTGSCTITASQAGNGDYKPAENVVREVQATKASQTIDFPQPSSPVKYKTSFTVSPSSSSGLPVGLSVSGSCTNDGYTVTMVQTSGMCTLTASQAGNSNYLPAATVSHQVEPAPNGNVIFIPLVFGD